MYIIIIYTRTVREEKVSSRLCLKLLSLDCLPDTIPHGHLNEILDQQIDVLPNASRQLALHAMHQQGQPFNHSNHLHQCILLFTRVVVTCSLCVCACKCVCVCACACACARVHASVYCTLYELIVHCVDGSKEPPGYISRKVIHYSEVRPHFCSTRGTELH